MPDLRYPSVRDRHENRLRTPPVKRQLVFILITAISSILARAQDAPPLSAFAISSSR